MAGENPDGEVSASPTMAWRESFKPAICALMALSRCSAVEAYRLRVEATALKAASDAAYSKDQVLNEESGTLQKSWSDARHRNPTETARLQSAWKVKDGEAEAAKLAFQDAEGGYQKRVDEGSDRLTKFTEQVAARETPITSYANIPDVRSGYARPRTDCSSATATRSCDRTP
jgi:hypothetical protein